MKVLHLLTSGETGGIESLCRDIGRYGQLEHTFCFVMHGGTVCEQMKREGMKVLDLEKDGGKLSLKKLIIISKAASDSDAVIIHHGDPFLKLYFILVKRLTGKYGVTMVHSCYGDESQIEYHGVKLHMLHSIFQKCFRVSDAVWFVSNAGKESSKKAYQIEEKKSRVIYNGISPEFLKKAYENELNMKTPYRITYIGRLSREKGVSLLLKAFAGLLEEYDAELSIVGDGTERQELEKLADTLHIADKVTFCGQQMDIHKYLKNTSIFVYPSTCQEVFGISIIEAMAYGIPCIANHVGGIPEIIENNKNGFLTSQPTSEQILFSLKKVIRMLETNEIDRISQSEKETACRFSIERTIGLMESELREDVIHG